MHFHPFCDNAVLIDLGNSIHRDVHEQVMRWFHIIREHPFPGFTEAVPAYSSIAVYYDPVMSASGFAPDKCIFENVVSHLETLALQLSSDSMIRGRHIVIPVCYDPIYARDLPELCMLTNLTPEDVIRLHTSRSYHVYMIGFLPGFAYMGEVEDVLFVPRKNNPVHVSGGSIGIAGRQTGIYPMDSPGGWHIIGRTPQQMFDPASENPVFLQPGDTVSFQPISVYEFEHYPDRHT